MNRKAFSTPELLVPIALIALLIAILLPCYAAVRGGYATTWHYIGLWSVIGIVALFIVLRITFTIIETRRIRRGDYRWK